MNTTTSLPHVNKNSATLFVLAAATLLASLGISVATVALPTLSRVFDASISSVQWVAVMYLVSVTVTIVLAGRMGDLFGHRRMLIAGIVVFAVGSALCAAAPTLAALIAARAAQGLGGAILMALPISIARGAVAGERIGSAMGLMATMSALGTALGPSLGGVLITGFGWRAAFILLTVLALLLLVLTRRAITSTPGAATRNIKGPLIPISLLRERSIGVSLATNLLVTAVMMSTLVVGPFFLFFGLGLNEALAGTVMAVGPVTAALFGVPAGRAADRFGTSRVLFVGLLQMTLGLICLALLPRLFGGVGYIVALMLLTPGFQLFLTANNTAVMVSARDDQRGMLSGLLGLSRNLGFMAGASLMSTLFAAVLGSQDINMASPQVIGDAFTTTFLVATGMALLALALVTFDTIKTRRHA